MLAGGFPTTRITTTRASSTEVFMSAMEDLEDQEVATKSSNYDIDRTWNIGGLRKEISRLTVRCHKKISKTSQRFQNAQQEVDRLTASNDVTMEELEACPNLDEISTELKEMQDRLKKLNQLEVLLQDFKAKKAVLPEHIAQLAIELQVQDEPQTQPERGAKKQKGPKTMSSFRLPYRRYYTSNKTEIRVRMIDSSNLAHEKTIWFPWTHDLSRHFVGWKASRR
jgi:hypothetical protein